MMSSTFEILKVYNLYDVDENVKKNKKNIV